MRNRLIRIVAVVVLGATVAIVPVAAGASVATAKGGCKYLKASEVARIIATPVKRGPNPPGPSGIQGCGYVPKDQALPVQVNVWVLSGASASIGFRVAKRAFKANLESAPGLGSNSFYAGGAINTTYVLTGGRLVFVQYVNIGGDKALNKAGVIKLMKRVLTRV